MPVLGVAETVFLASRLVVSCRNRSFCSSRNGDGEHDEAHFYPPKHAFKTTKMKQMAGATPAKARFTKSSVLGTEIWEGDEHRKFQFLESGASLNGRNLFTELSFL